MATRTNPYIGPSPFELNDQLFFYGRDGEANELFSLICAHSTVLCYSQSGAGKTSLINARIIPKLKEQQAEILGTARVGIKLPKNIQASKITNHFVFNTLLSLEGEKSEIPFDRLGRMSLVEYLKQRKPDGQYEKFDPLQVLIFDQFEELFTSFPEHWAKREKFFLNVSEALAAYPFLRVVFAMREEYIGALDPFAPMLPQRLQKRFRLERLRKEAAKRAVEGPVERLRELQDPAERTGRYYGPGVVEALVNNLLQEQIKQGRKVIPTTGEFVEPVQLQIVCQGLWEALPKDVKEIDKPAVAKFGDVNAALAKYYDDALKKVPADEGRLRIWFGRSLITPVGTRATVYMDEGRTEDNLSEAVVNKLEELRLIRPELRGGAKWYELTHDRFIEPILRSNDKWFGLLPADKTFLDELEKKASRWEEQGKPNSVLLTDDELREMRPIRRRRSKLRRITESVTLKDYIAASETVSERRRLYWRIFSLAVIPILTLIMIGVTIFSSFKTWQASREQKVKQVQRGEQAKGFADVEGREYSALAFGIEAVGLSEPNDAPTEAIEGLRAALTAIDNKIWLREGATNSPVTRLQLTADGRLALAVSSNELCIWDTLTGQKTFTCLPRLEEEDEWTQVEFFPDGKFLFIVTTPIEITREESQSKLNPRDDGANGETGAARKTERGGERKVFIVNARSGEFWAELQGQLKGAWGLQVSNNGKYILAEFGDYMKIMNLDSKSISDAPASQSQWMQVALSTDGTRLIAVYEGTRVELLATDSGEVINNFDVSIPRTAEAWDAIAFSPDGKRGALVRSSPKGQETFGIVWDNITGQRLALFKSKIGKVEDAGFSSDNTSVIVFGVTKAETFDAGTGNIIRTSPLPQGEITQRSGTSFLAVQSGISKSRITVWDALAGTAKAPADTTKYNVTKAAMTPDASKVVTASQDGVIVVWTVGESLKLDGLQPEDLLSTACRKLLYQKEYVQVSKICEKYQSSPSPTP